MANLRVFFDLSIDGIPAGRIVMELFADSTPITAENFQALCTGEKGIGTVGKPLHYKGSTFHRVIPGYMVHGGDITQGNGTGGESIYGSSFADENFVKKHIGPSILSMAKTNTLSNWSQFCICTTIAEWLDGKQVVFGEMVEGFVVLKAIDQIDSSSGLTSKTLTAIGDHYGLGCQTRNGTDFLNGFHDVKPLDDLTEEDVGAIEPLVLCVRDEKLGVVGVWVGICHGEDPGTSVLVYEVFIGESVATYGLTSESIEVCQASSCEHRAGNHVVEDCSLVVEWHPVPADSLLAGAKSPKILRCYGGSVDEKLYHKSTSRMAADVQVKEHSRVCLSTTINIRNNITAFNNTT
ncbi:hypothetical protein EZV62_024513 [Acer yangbiense]|uniref:peptidylprolyl isomerase n=1 Tax=Acer yangbiense TaxID=1000413 RepID=A0A5C7GVB2_9ROSI|nr:hypothetical protein EZV62_024513 [Acer yangbiense]